MTERFTDEELAFLRFARFGQLPQRVLPYEWVELQETEQPSLPVCQPFETPEGGQFQAF